MLNLLAVVGVALVFLGFAIWKEIAGLAALGREQQSTDPRDDVPDALHAVVTRNRLRYWHEQFLRLRDGALQRETKLKESGQLDVEPLPEREMRQVVADYVMSEEFDSWVTRGLKLNADVFAGRLTREEARKENDAPRLPMGFTWLETNRRTEEWVGRIREIVRNKDIDNVAAKVK